MRKIIIFFVACIATILSTVSCDKQNSDLTDSDIKIASAETVKSKARRMIGEERIVKATEQDYVPESIARTLIDQLQRWGAEGKELAQSLSSCSAARAYSQSRSTVCDSELGGEIDNTCLLKHGFGRKSVGQALTADRIDLNGDKVPDYLISDRYYCMSLSANQSNVFFVLLSQPSGEFRLSFADWASYGLEVVEDPIGKKKFLIERAPKTYGIYTKILHLENGRYRPRICILQDESGFSKCGIK